MALHLWMTSTPDKERDRLLEQLNTPPPRAAVAQPPGGRRPKDWGANDDEAEASSLRALAALKR